MCSQLMQYLVELRDKSNKSEVQNYHKVEVSAQIEN